MYISIETEFLDTVSPEAAAANAKYLSAAPH